MKHKKLSARTLSLALSAAMLFSMMPTNVFATSGGIPIGASSIEKSEKTITAFDELGDGLTKSVPFDGHTYALTVKLNTPIEEITLPTELGVMVERTTITTQPEKDEVQDSGEVPKDTAPTDEPATPSDAETAPALEDKPDEEVPPATLISFDARNGAIIDDAMANPWRGIYCSYTNA